VRGDSDPRFCQEDTRTKILKEAENWLAIHDDKSLLWVNGLPGAGKSWIADTLVEQLRKKGRKVIYFQFNQNSRADATARVLCRSVAYQLADQFVDSRQAILTALRDDPRMTDPELLKAQDVFDKLITKALETSKDLTPDRTPIVVIDALDECGGEAGISAAGRRDELLVIIRKWAQLLPHCKLVVTSRDEADIRRALVQVSKEVVLHAGNDVDFESSADIRTYIAWRLKVIAERELPLGSNWPSAGDVDALAKHAAGLFIWAKTACDYIDTGVPRERLAELLSLRSNIVGMKGMYSVTLERAFSRSTETELAAVRVVMGTMIALATPLSLEAMTMLINARDKKVLLTTDQAFHVRSRISSVLLNNVVPKFAHLSFPEFLQSLECPEKFRIDVKVEHYRLALSALKIMNQLRFNICNLETSQVLNDEAPELSKRIEADIAPHLLYACQFWAEHLVQATFDRDLAAAASNFVHLRALFWLEALSLVKKTSGASRMLVSLANWSSVCFILCNECDNL
jgi:hypothetical protein